MAFLQIQQEYRKQHKYDTQEKWNLLYQSYVDRGILTLELGRKWAMLIVDLI